MATESSAEVDVEDEDSEKSVARSVTKSPQDKKQETLTVQPWVGDKATHGYSQYLASLSELAFLTSTKYWYN